MIAADAGPCALPARELGSRIREGRLTAADALEAHLARIGRQNPALNAVVLLDAERARATAGAADAALRRGEVWGPLHGVPLTLKDGHDVAGLRTTLGAPDLDRIATSDGAVAARLRAAGANVIGHTNVAAWLADPLQSANPLFGRSANPWDTGRTPGGSGGGAAAAVAAGLTPLEVGSDLAGSIRVPAHFCGVYGLKPTEHRVPLSGFFRPPDGGPRPVRVMLSLGPLARDLGDLRLALSLLAGPDGCDGDVAPVPLPPPRPCPLGDLRLAVAPSLPGVRVDRDVRRRVEQVAARAADAGARAAERLPEVDWDAQDALFRDLVGALTGAFDPQAGLQPEHRTLAWYLEALDRRDRLGETWEAFFEDVDALLVPAAPTTAFTHRETGAPLEVDRQAVSYWEAGRLVAFVNLAGLPALSVPTGPGADGLPIGLQLIGPRWSEPRLLEIAQELERAGVLPGFQAPPSA